MEHFNWLRELREFLSIPKRLSGISENIHKNTEAVSAANERQHEQDNVGQEWRDKVFSEYKQTEGNRTTNDNRNYRVQNSIRWAAWFAFVAAAIYAGISGYQLRELRRSIRLSNRSWVGVSRPISLMSVKYGKEPTASYVVTIKNYGPSVALNEWTVAHIISNYENISNGFGRACAQAIGGAEGTRFRAGEGIPKDILGESLFAGDEPGKWFTQERFDEGPSFFIVGCIAYKDQFGELHTTKFCNWYNGRPPETTDSTITPLFLYPYFEYNEAN